MSFQISIDECRYGTRCTNGKCKRLHPGDRIVISIPENSGWQERDKRTTRNLSSDKSHTSRIDTVSSHRSDSDVKKITKNKKFERPICKYGPNCLKKDNGCKFKH